MMASFLSLPPEIRVQIYRELFHSKDLEDRKQTITDEINDNSLHLLNISKSYKTQPPLVFVPSQQHEIASPILRTSSTIYREASEIFYNETSFHYYSQPCLIGELPTFSCINNSFRRIQHAELVMNFNLNMFFPSATTVHGFFEALRCFSERACLLKSLHLDIIDGSNPQILWSIDTDNFGHLIRDFGPNLERITIFIQSCCKERVLKMHVQKRWFSNNGWDECNEEELEILNPINRIPKWTFRRKSFSETSRPSDSAITTVPRDQ